MENWVQTSQVVPPSQRKALMELAIFTKCRHVLALLIPPKVCCSAVCCNVLICRQCRHFLALLFPA